MIFGVLVAAGVVVALIYYVYRQATDPGVDLFPKNRIAHAGGFRSESNTEERD